MGLKETIIAVMIFTLVLNISLGVVSKLPAFIDGGSDLGGMDFEDNYDSGWKDSVEGTNNSVYVGDDKVADSGATSG